MGNDSHANAMTEVALALAMGIFSILVLALVSMGVGFSAGSEAFIPAAEGIEFRQSFPGQATVGAAHKGMVLMHHRGRFYDAELALVDPSGLPSDEELVIAIDPTATATEAVTLTTRFAGRNVVITTLTPEWLQTLKEIQP